MHTILNDQDEKSKKICILIGANTMRKVAVEGQIVGARDFKQHGY